MPTWNERQGRPLDREIEDLLRDFRGSRAARRLFWELLGYDGRDETIILDHLDARFRHSILEARRIASHYQFHIHQIAVTRDVLDGPILGEICRAFARKHRQFAILFHDVGCTEWRLAYLADDRVDRRRVGRVRVLRIGHPDENPRRQARMLARLRAYDHDDEPVGLLELIEAYDHLFRLPSRRAKSSRRALQGLSALIEEIGRYPLLSAREERALLMELDQIAPQRSVEEGNRTKVYRYPRDGRQERYKEVRDRLILHNLRLCLYIAKGYARNEEELLELFQEGVVGLHRAIDLIDPSRGLRFSTYAYRWIRQAVSRWGMQRRSLIRIPVHLHAGPKERRPRIGLVSFDEAGGEDVIENARSFNQASMAELDAIDIQMMVSRGLKKLNGRYATVLIHRFGLQGQREMTLQEIGDFMGLTRERVRQLGVKALEKIRYHLASHGECL